MLNDPAVLRACIPGCEALDTTQAGGLKAKVTTKIGPVKATFAGEVTFANVEPMERYTLEGSGSGGIAGFAKGGADVALLDDGEGTMLTYAARAQVGGKLAQLGSRLIDSTARKLAEQFFTAFAAQAAAAADAPPEVDLSAIEPSPLAEAPLAATTAAPVPGAGSQVKGTQNA